MKKKITKQKYTEERSEKCQMFSVNMTESLMDCLLVAIRVDIITLEITLWLYLLKSSI